MYVRTLYGPDAGSLIETRRDQPPTDYYLVHPTHYVVQLVWVDETRVLLNLSNGTTTLMDVESGDVLATTNESWKGDILVAADKLSFWIIGKEISQHTLPDLTLLSRAFGVQQVQGEDWRLVTDIDSVPPVTEHGHRYYDDFRSFESKPGTFIALSGNRAMGTAPAGGNNNQDRQYQGTELMKINFETGEVKIQRLPGTRHAKTKPILSFSPDGRLALRPCTEPIFKAKSKQSLLDKIVRRSKTQPPRLKGRPEILVHDTTTYDPNMHQIGFPLEIWDVSETPTLLGLVIPEWHGADLRALGIKLAGTDSSAPIHPPELTKKIGSIISDIASNEPNQLADFHDRAVFYGSSIEALFNLTAILNRLETPMLTAVLDQQPEHRNFGVIQRLEAALYAKTQEINQPPVWLRGGAEWEILSLCKQGELVQISAKGDAKRIKLPALADIPLSEVAAQHAKFSSGEKTGGYFLSSLYQNPRNAIISTNPFNDILVATGAHPTILRPEHADIAISAKAGAHCSPGAWRCVYTDREDKSEETKLTKKLINEGRFGVVSIRGSTEKHYIAALEEMLSYFVKSPAKLVHQSRYTPTFRQRSRFIDETVFCAELVRRDYKGAVPILDQLIVASYGFHGKDALSVWHDCGGIHTCAPMVFARFQLAGAFGNEAIEWLHGHDAGHEHFCMNEMNRLADKTPRDDEDYAKAASVIFWHDLLHGRLDDPRSAPFFLSARSGLSESEFRLILRASLETHLARYQSDRSIILEGVMPNKPTDRLEDAIEVYVDWALQNQ